MTMQSNKPESQKYEFIRTSTALRVVPVSRPVGRIRNAVFEMMNAAEAKA